MKYLDEELEYITLYETPETDEALEILRAKRQPYIVALIVSLVLASISFVLFITSATVFLYLLVLFAALDIIILLIGFFALKPYKQLLAIAKRNDRLRHEERVKFKEHIRLETEFNIYKPTKEQIEETFNLDNLQKLKTKKE